MNSAGVVPLFMTQIYDVVINSYDFYTNKSFSISLDYRIIIVTLKISVNGIVIYRTNQQRKYIFYLQTGYGMVHSHIILLQLECRIEQNGTTECAYQV